MTKWLLIGLIGLFQTGERIPTGRGLEQTGGTLEIEKIETRLTAKPYAAYFDAESTVTLLGLTGDVTMAGLVFSKDRRVTDMRIKGRTASYRHIGDFLLIDMKPSLPKGQRRQVQMSYKGKVFGLSPELAMDFKIRGYTGTLTISPPMSTVDGTIRAEIEVPLKRTHRRLPPLGLQLNDLYQVEAVRWNGQPVPYTHTRGTIRPELKPPLKWGGQRGAGDRFRRQDPLIGFEPGLGQLRQRGRPPQFRGRPLDHSTGRWSRCGGTTGSRVAVRRRSSM